QLRGAIETQRTMVGDGRFAVGILEVSGEVELRQSGHRSHLGQRHRPGDMCVKEFARSLEPAVELAAGRKLDRLEPVDRRAAALERARKFLHAHIARAVTLAEMASVAGLSQFHLARYFKDAYGESPISYHRALRLDRAAKLLAAGGRSLAEVAEATGYSDQVALSHAFRRTYGVSPQSWTRQRGLAA